MPPPNRMVAQFAQSIFKVHEEMGHVRFPISRVPNRIDQRSWSFQIDVVPPHGSQDVAIESHCEFSGAHRREGTTLLSKYTRVRFTKLAPLMLSVIVGLPSVTITGEIVRMPGGPTLTASAPPPPSLPPDVPAFMATTHGRSSTELLPSSPVPPMNGVL